MSKPNYLPLDILKFLSGVKDFTTEETGAFILLLIEQWDSGFIENSPKKLKKITGISAKKLEKVLEKFEKKDEKIFNFKLDQIRKKVVQKIETNKVNGKKGAEVRLANAKISLPRSLEQAPIQIDSNLIQNLNESKGHPNFPSTLNPDLNGRFLVGTKFYDCTPFEYVTTKLKSKYEQVMMQFSGLNLESFKAKFNKVYLVRGFSDDRHAIASMEVIAKELYNNKDQHQQTSTKPKYPHASKIDK